MFGGYTTPQGAIRDAKESGLANVPVDPALAAIDDPEVWFKESFELAKKFAYAEPVFSVTQPIELTRDDGNRGAKHFPYASCPGRAEARQHAK